MRGKLFHGVIGIDEAGRGPLAGPVAVGGVMIRRKSALRALSGIRDSKKLTAEGREKWFRMLTAHPDFVCASVMIGPATIDRVNVRNAVLLGAQKIYRRLAAGGESYVLLDGGLFLPADVAQETIIKGDEKIPLIAAASIIAKVRRDRLMMRLHKKYPQYRFDLHKGYGTALHRMLVAQYGRSPVHRRSFQWRES